MIRCAAEQRGLAMQSRLRSGSAHALPLRGAYKLRPARMPSFWPSLAIAALGSLAAWYPGVVGAQQASQPQISVASTIVAEPASQTTLAIQIGPPGVLPEDSFVRMRGLPPGVSLTEGLRVAPGWWVTSLVALPRLKANVPADIGSGRAELVIALVGKDGKVLAETRTAFVVASAAMVPSQEKALADPGQPPFASAAPPVSTPAAKEDPHTSARMPTGASAEDKHRAESALVLGEKYLASGRVLVAREFFQRAADAGQATGALRLAATYDPVELKRLQLQGIVPNRALARRWYERARELGAPEADELLAKLAGN
jgi:hypothetical protein